MLCYAYGSNKYISVLVMIGVFCACVALLLFVFLSKLIGMFADSNVNQTGVNTGVEYLSVVSMFCFFMGLMVIKNGVFRGIGDVKVFMFSSLTNLS